MGRNKDDSKVMGLQSTEIPYPWMYAHAPSLSTRPTCTRIGEGVPAKSAACKE